MKSKFMLIYEDIMEKIVNVSNSPISFKFNKDSDGVISSKFSDIDDDGNVIVINAKYDGKSTNFNVQEQEEDDVFMDEKQFMMKFNKLYSNYKKALDKYKKDNNIVENSDVEIINDTNTSNVVPEVRLFNEILKNIDAIPNNEGTEIKTKSGIFTFKKIDDDKYKNIATANFILINPNAEDDELTKYDATIIIKMINKNSVITQIQLNDPKDNSEIDTITESDFKEKYPNTYQDFREALRKFEKEFNQNNINI